MSAEPCGRREEDRAPGGTVCKAGCFRAWALSEGGQWPGRALIREGVVVSELEKLRQGGAVSPNHL